MKMSFKLLLPFVTLCAVGCGGTTELNSGPPSQVTLVARGGFHQPTDAVSSPDGATFYFIASTDANQPAIFRVDSQPGSQAAALVSGAALGQPMGLLMSCDGATLYVAGSGANPLQAVTLSDGSLHSVSATGATRLSGLAIADDCATLYATGTTTQAEPALFRLAQSSSALQVVHSGAPFIAPSGMYLDSRSVAWVMDQSAAGSARSGVLYAVASNGTTTPVVNALSMPGRVGGVSLTASGNIAVIANLSADAVAQLTTIELATGKTVQVAAAAMRGPAGLRTARAASVIAIADAAGDAIFRAE